MRSKKLLSLILVLCMILPLIPAFATEGTQTEPTSNVTMIYENDFNTNIDGWGKGETLAAEDTYDLKQETYEDKGVLALSSTSNISNDLNKQPNAFLDLEDVVFEDGKKLIIETSFKHAGNADGNAWSYLKFNRTNTLDFTGVTNTIAEDQYNYWIMFWMRNNDLRHLEVNDFSSSKTFATVDTINNWTDVQIVIDETTKKFSIEAKTGDAVNTASDVPFDAHSGAKTITGITEYNSLKDLTLYLRDYAQTLYVDYFRVYEAEPVYANAMIVGGSTVKYDEAAQIKFINVYSDSEKTTPSAVAAVPAGSFTITDKDGKALDVIQEYDAENQIVSVKPADGFVKGETYTIALNDTKLGTMGINCSGTKSFTVRARDERTNGVGLYDTFATGTDGWEIGASVEDYEASLSQASATEGDENYDEAVVGATDGKALKVSFKDKKTDSSSQSVVSNITKAVGEGIKFNNDKSVIIKTRIKKTADIDYQLRLNRPDTLDQLANEEQWLNYFILRNNETTGLAVMRGISDASWSDLCYPTKDTIAGSSNIDYKNKWVTYTLEFKPADRNYHTTVTYTGDDGNEVTVLDKYSEGVMQAQKNAYEKEYGVGTFGDATTGQYYDALERLTFAGYFAGDIYIDYVKVYENVETKAVIDGGRTVDKNGAFKLSFIDTGYTNSEEEFVAGKLDLIPAGGVTVEGVTVKESFDKDTQTLTLTPATPLTEGDTYKVTVNTDVLADAGIEYKGTTEFNVRARGARSTGVVVDDNFATAAEKNNWAIGSANDDWQAVTDIVDAEGATDGKALSVTMKTKENAADGTNQIPNVIRNIGGGIEFNAGKKVVIKARMKVESAQNDETGDAASTKFYLRLNTIGYENNGAKYDQHATNGWYAYSLFSAGQKVEYPSDAGDAFGENGWYYSKGTVSGTDNSAIIGKWVDYTVVLDGVNNTSTITAVCDDPALNETVNAYVGVSPRALVNEYGEGTTKTHYDALDTLSFALFDNANTNSELLIDSFKVYEQYEAYALMPAGNTVKYDDTVKLQFVSDEAIAAIPAGAVKIDGAVAVQEYDAATKTLSVKPEADFVKGTTYAVTIDTDVLAEDGIIYTGTESFSVKARGDFDTGVVIDDNFATGADSWIVGEAYSDDYKAKISSAEDEGAEDKKVLKIEFPTKQMEVNDSTAAYGSVTKALDNGIEFNDDTTVTVKTRIKRTDSTTPFELRVNRPNTVEQVKHDYDWITYYTAFAQKANADGISTADDSLGKDIGIYSGLYGYHSYTAGSATKVDLTNKWVEYTINYKPVEGEYYLTVTYTDDNDEQQVVTENQVGYMRATKPVLDKEFGLGYFNYESGRQFFNDLKSLTFTSAGGTILVDYVKVYTIYESYATMPEGSSVKYDEPIKLVFESSEEIPSIPAGTVKINGNAAKQEYDAETKTLSVTLANENNFTEGETYNVTIDKDVLATVGITYTGTEEFVVRARGARSSGKVINDTFDGTYNDDATSFDGWSAGVANEGYAADIDVVTPADDTNATGATGGALKISMKTPATGNGNQSSVTRLIGNGIEFKDNTHITIKTRIKRTSSDTYYLLKMNRPDTVVQTEHEYEWRTYGIMGALAGTAGITTATYFEELDGKNTSMPAGPGSEGIDYTNKWVDYTITYKPETQCYYVTAVTEDDTVILNERVGANGITVPAAQREYGIGTVKGAFNALERLTFYGQTGGDIYIDYVEVYDTTVIDENISAKLMVGNSEADVLTAGMEVVPTFELQPKNAVETKYYTISAVYVDGKLDKFNVTPVTTTGTTTTHNAYTVPDTAGKVEIKAFVWDENFVPLCNNASAVKEALNTFTVYVRTDGSDSATGANASVATLGEALNRVYAATDVDAAQIIVGDGNYKVDDTISIPEGANIPDGGLTIKAENNRKAVFVGGNTYTYEDMVKVSDDDAIFNKIPAAAKGKIYKISLADIETIPAVSYPGTSDYRVDKIVKGVGLEDDTTLTDVTLDVAFDGKLMTIARWPNVSAEGKNVYETATSVSGATDVEAYHTMIKLYEDAAAVAALGETTKATLKTNIQKGITVGVPNKDISKWAADGALMFGYWGRDWATQTMPVGAVDATNGTITSKYASSFGAKANARFYVFNLLCELDSDGEYYIDRTKKVMYFYKDTAPTQASKVTISTLDKTMLEISSDDKVTVDGLVFENSRGEGIYLKGSTGTVIKNCEIRNLGYRAMSISARESRVENNYIHDTNGGIILNAQDSINDVKNLAQSNNVIHNNEIKNYARLDQVYVDGIELKGTGNTVSNNKIHDSEHLAVRISGYNNTFINNEITDVLNQVDDAGAIYMGKSWANRGNKIVSNYIHDIKTSIDSTSPIAGIFLDDHYAGAYIEGNVFKNITNGHGIRTNRGRENTITNNLFINCTKGGLLVSGENYDDGEVYGLGTTQHNSIFGGANPISTYCTTSELWQNTFPTLCTLVGTLEGSGDGTKAYANWGDPAAVVVTKNLAIGCGNEAVSVAAFAATYTDTFNGVSLNSNVSNNGGNETAAVLGTNKDDATAKAYIASSVTTRNYEAVAENPALATAEFAAAAGIENFTPINFAAMRK